MKLTNEELKENLLEELYNFITEHNEIQIEHSVYGENIICVKVGLTVYECDKSHLNAFIRGYQVAIESEFLKVYTENVDISKYLKKTAN